MDVQPDVSDLELQPLDINYKDSKRCFKHCVKNFGISYLDHEEDDCIKNCLSKYMQARVFVSQKSQFWMVQMIQSDPNLRAKEVKKKYQKQAGEWERPE